MEKQDFKVNPKEWWLFDYQDWKQYPILNVKFEDLGPVEMLPQLNAEEHQSISAASSD